MKDSTCGSCLPAACASAVLSAILLLPPPLPSLAVLPPDKGARPCGSLPSLVVDEALPPASSMSPNLNIGKPNLL